MDQKNVDYTQNINQIINQNVNRNYVDYSRSINQLQAQKVNIGISNIEKQWGRLFNIENSDIANKMMKMVQKLIDNNLKNFKNNHKRYWELIEKLRFEKSEQERIEKELEAQELFNLNQIENEMNKNILNQQDEANKRMLENEKRRIVENKKLENAKLKEQIRIKKWSNWNGFS